MRIPDRLYVLMERVYLAERRRRRRELDDRVQAEDRAIRLAADRQRDAHRAGTCGGPGNGCGYFPCYTVRD